MRRTCATGSSGDESSSSWRAASRPESVSEYNLAATDFGGEREHAAQHVAERRAVVARDPAAQRQQLGVEHGFGVEQAERVACGDFGRIVVAAHDHAGELARSERDQEAAARTDAMPQRVGKADT